MNDGLNLVMFDIDGTLVRSYDFDEACFSSTIKEVLGITLTDAWQGYPHITDAGIVRQLLAETYPSEQRVSLFESIRSCFIEKVHQHIDKKRLTAVVGAVEFLSYLRARDDVVVSIATGGWYESAIMKLEAAGIDYSGIPMASSSDHFSRTEIMKLAEAKCGHGNFLSRTYFGDAVWDKEASRELGFNFISVGDRVSHDRVIKDYRAVNDIVRLMGL